VPRGSLLEQTRPAATGAVILTHRGNHEGVSVGCNLRRCCRRRGGFLALLPVTVTDAKAAVLCELADKDSVKFEDVRIYKKSQTVCGLVNAKNSSAGYAGFLPFVYDIKTNPLIGQLASK
jgi:hypothetical protein